MVIHVHKHEKYYRYSIQWSKEIFKLFGHFLALKNVCFPFLEFVVQSSLFVKLILTKTFGNCTKRLIMVEIGETDFLAILVSFSQFTQILLRTFCVSSCFTLQLCADSFSRKFSTAEKKIAQSFCIFWSSLGILGVIIILGVIF